MSEIIWLPHPGEDQGLEAKLAWFHSLTMEERMDHLVRSVDEFLAADPGFKQPLPEPVEGRIAVYSMKCIVSEDR